MSFTINEGSAFSIEAQFYDASHQPSAPTSIRYRVKDVENNRVVRDWTDIATGTSITITVAAGDNVILDKSTRNRLRRQSMSLVVQADPGLDSQFNNEFLYEIRNLRGFES